MTPCCPVVRKQAAQANGALQRRFGDHLCDTCIGLLNEVGAERWSTVCLDVPSGSAARSTVANRVPSTDRQCMALGHVGGTNLVEEALAVVDDVPEGVVVVPAQLRGAAQQLHHRRHHKILQRRSPAAAGMLAIGK